jgi:hypothetical protein
LQIVALLDQVRITFPELDVHLSLIIALNQDLHCQVQASPSFSTLMHREILSR